MTGDASPGPICIGNTTTDELVHCVGAIPLWLPVTIEPTTRKVDRPIPPYPVPTESPALTGAGHRGSAQSAAPLPPSGIERTGRREPRRAYQRYLAPSTTLPRVYEQAWFPGAALAHGTDSTFHEFALGTQVRAYLAPRR
ncbi:hypothetical protein DCS_07301 [Drechmeria coniospora]|uniref:Uncharacterized protein n=1 Tax=Drechmeria coniospora TaxID=98403 RepID=A0A151GE23_DRECN|nr:hypothetical protein DCS_07301 [Drechmeria coniospora]KYK55338.1 hypothetical protein DCS_07301 [Drechmeria coniospora]